jgi:hypothetical protein
MKKLVVLMVLSVLVMNAMAADYKEVMRSSIQKMVQAKTIDELTGLANQFVRISEAEKGEWLPGYYSAYCYVAIVSQMNPDKTLVSKYLDMAQEILDKVTQRASNESEVYTLQALIYQLRITDIQTGMKYSPMASEALAVAGQLNSNNPRVYYLQGLNVFYAPEMYGGGGAKAKSILEKAITLFDSENPKELYPSWGKEHAQMILEQCKSTAQ